jgi:hypothetical protein
LMAFASLTVIFLYSGIYATSDTIPNTAIQLSNVVQFLFNIGKCSQSIQ